MISFYSILSYIFYLIPLFSYTLLIATCTKASNNNDNLENSSISEKKEESVEDEENSQDRPVASPSDEKEEKELDAEANSENDDKSDNTVNAVGSNAIELKTISEPSPKSAAESHTKEIYVPIGAAMSRPERKSILCKSIKVTEQQKIAHSVSFKGTKFAAS